RNRWRFDVAACRLSTEIDSPVVRIFSVLKCQIPGRARGPHPTGCGARLRINVNGGRGEIRTHGTLAGTPVFKTGALNRSATLPLQRHQSLSIHEVKNGRRTKPGLAPPWPQGRLKASL